MQRIHTRAVYNVDETTIEQMEAVQNRTNASRHLPKAHAGAVYATHQAPSISALSQILRLALTVD